MKHEFENFLTDLFPGFYESVLYNSDTEYYLSEEENKPLEIKDWDNFTKTVCEDVVNIWWNSVDDNIIKSIKFKKLDSPRYYNYGTDKIIADIDVDYNELNEYLINNSDSLQTHLNTYYKSRDGFTSFIENDINEFMNNYKKIDLNYLDVAIEFYIMQCLDDYYFDTLAEIASNRQWEYAEEVENEEGE